LGALDKMLREEMQVELRNLQQRLGITAVFVTHDQEEALTLSDRVAVMRNGAIEQIGAPREIYERPRNEFVAGFLGASNFLDGTVLARDHTGAVVETAAGRIRAIVESAGIGSKVRIAVRPERVRVGPAPADGLPARIRNIVYRGPSRTSTWTAPQDHCCSYQQNAGAQTWQVGDEVRCAWDAQSGVAIVPERA
jgi:putative spermidine/putrescine transport system ATP-binding protein/spermidine/putrescine transport system ATP-binding protein